MFFKTRINLLSITAKLMNVAKILYTGEMLRWWIIGITFVGINIGSLYFLVDRLGLPVVMSTLIAAEMGTILRYACNDLWVFKQEKLTFLRLFKYHIANAGSFAVWWAVTNLIILNGGHYSIASIMGMASSVLLSVATNFLWIWRRKPKLDGLEK